MGLGSDFRLQPQPGIFRIVFQGCSQLPDQLGPHLRRRCVRVGYNDHAPQIAALFGFFITQTGQNMRNQGRRLAAAGRCRNKQRTASVTYDFFLHRAGNKTHDSASFSSARPIISANSSRFTFRIVRGFMPGMRLSKRQMLLNSQYVQGL